jgi:hypothetical protein
MAGGGSAGARPAANLGVLQVAALAPLGGRLAQNPKHGSSDRRPPTNPFAPCRRKRQEAAGTDFAGMQNEDEAAAVTDRRGSLQSQLPLDAASAAVLGLAGRWSAESADLRWSSPQTGATLDTSYKNSKTISYSALVRSSSSNARPVVIRKKRLDILLYASATDSAGWPSLDRFRCMTVVWTCVSCPMSRRPSCVASEPSSLIACGIFRMLRRSTGRGAVMLVRSPVTRLCRSNSQRSVRFRGSPPVRTTSALPNGLTSLRSSHPSSVRQLTHVPFRLCAGAAMNARQIRHKLALFPKSPTAGTG